MNIYIDITSLEKLRVNTGIQRVVKEFLNYIIQYNTNVNFKILVYNIKINKFEELDNREIKSFLKDIKNYNFNNNKMINIENIKSKDLDIFFDIDSSWNTPYKREKLYPILKNNGFLIYNFIHDMIPILLPQYVQNITVNNFIPYIKAVSKYSDNVIFNSKSSLNDFFDYHHNNLKSNRNVNSSVIHLGCDFFKSNKNIEDKNILDLLSKKYILFVGTVEPRKSHKEVLDAFNILTKKYDELNLIFVGIKGWNNDTFIEELTNHPLKDKKLFWLTNINDDTLYYLYSKAYIVTYLSKYEGFGLPIVESLLHGNITIASNNSSMPEVGKEFADYVNITNEVNQLVSIISMYLNDKELYKNKKKLIINKYTATSWLEFSSSIYNQLEIKYRDNMKLRIKNKIKSIPIFGNIIKKIYKKSKKLFKNNKKEYLDKYYLAFENKFRGSRNSILNRYKNYLRFIDPNIKNALDIGSGRGEWTQLLQERNIQAYGVDMNESMTNIAKTHGVKNLVVKDAFSYLKSCKDNTFDLITAFHIIEHIPYENLIELLLEIKRVASPNAIILLETPNPKNIQVAACNFYTDPTHLNPLPPEVVKFMVEYVGFKETKIEYLNPMAEEKQINEKTQVAIKVNELFYQAQDYLVIAKNGKK